MGRGMVLGEVVATVVTALAPEDEKLALMDAILDPVKAHIHGFRFSLAHGAVGNSGGTGIVGLDGGGRLWIAHFFKGSTEVDSVTGIVE